MEFSVAKVRNDDNNNNNNNKKKQKAFFLPTSRFETGFPPVSIEMAVFTSDREIELNGEQSAGTFIQYLVMRSDTCKWV